MKYYTIIKNDDIFAKYIKESDGDIALISFCDDDIQDIYMLFKQSCEKEQTFDKSLLRLVNFEFCGEDNYFYKMSYETGDIQKIIKCPLNKLYTQYKINVETAKKLEEKKKYIACNYESDCIIKQKSVFTNYEKYEFIDRESLRTIAFRLKKSNQNKKMPLVIYFHGAGAIGEDNKKQFLEYQCMGLGLSKRKCNVLVPQSANEVGENISIITSYCKMVNKLVKKLSEIVQIDYDRVYIVGASYGGACVWYSIYGFPNFYAAAIPLMGYFPTCNSDTFDARSFIDENIWIGHADNDNVVLINDDKAMYEMLKDINCNVKMTTYKKFGHAMSGVFFRKEKWKKWLFKQKRNIKQNI